MTTFTKRVAESKLQATKGKLDSTLRDLALRVSRAQDDLKAGKDIETRIMANAAELDALVAQYNTLRDLLEAIAAEEAGDAKELI